MEMKKERKEEKKVDGVEVEEVVQKVKGVEVEEVEVDVGCDYLNCHLCLDLSLSLFLLPEGQDEEGLTSIGPEVGEANVYTIAVNDI